MSKLQQRIFMFLLLLFSFASPESVDTQRKTLFKGAVEDAVKAHASLSSEDQALRCEKEDELIFGELKQYGIAFRNQILGQVEIK